MSDEALQRTVRRVGAVVVVAVGALTMSFLNYLEYQGYPLGIWDQVAVLLVGGAFAYLAGSSLVGVLAALDENAPEASDDGERTADGPG